MVAPTPGAYPGARFSRGSDMLINALPDYGVTGTRGSKVALQEAPDLHAPNFKGVSGAGSGYFSVDGVVFGQRATNYHQILDPTGSHAALQIGNATDPTIYYNNTTHSFRNRSLSGMLTITLSGSNAHIAASQTNANLRLAANGTGVISPQSAVVGAAAINGTMAANTIKGNNTGGTTQSVDLTPAQVISMLGNTPTQISVQVDLNTVGDTLLTPSLPSGFTRFRITGITVVNTSNTASLTTAQVGVFTAAGGGGSAIVASGSSLAAITTNAVATNAATLALAQAIGGTAYFNAAPYFRVTTGQGAAAGQATVTVIALITPVS